MEDESGLPQSINDDLDSSDIQRDEIEGEIGLLEGSLMKFILQISKEIKWKVKVVLLEVSLNIFILRISKEIKFKVKVEFLEVSLMNLIVRVSKKIKW